MSIFRFASRRAFGHLLSLVCLLASAWALGGCASFADGSRDGGAVAGPEREWQFEQLVPGESLRGDLDCPSGRCSVRYRIPVDRAGTLRVRVRGTIGNGPGSGPRIARVLLEGPGHSVLARGSEDASALADELTVSGAVGPGDCFLVINALGGPVDYDVSAEFGPPAVAAAPAAPSTSR